MNRTGESTAFCGAPALLITMSDVHPLSLTYCGLPVTSVIHSRLSQLVFQKEGMNDVEGAEEDEVRPCVAPRWWWPPRPPSPGMRAAVGPVHERRGVWGQETSKEPGLHMISSSFLEPLRKVWKSDFEMPTGSDALISWMKKNIRPYLFIHIWSVKQIKNTVKPFQMVQGPYYKWDNSTICCRNMKLHWVFTAKDYG